MALVLPNAWLVYMPLHFGQSGKKHVCFRFSTPWTSPRRSRGLFYFFRAGLLELMRQPAFFGSYAAMGAMQTAVVALALGKNSLPMACESSLRFGARPAE